MLEPFHGSNTRRPITRQPCLRSTPDRRYGGGMSAAPETLFATVAPPGAANIPLTIGALTLAITAVAAVAAWSARETYRIHMNDLGRPDAVPVSKPDYDRMRAQSLAQATA